MSNRDARNRAEEEMQYDPRTATTQDPGTDETSEDVARPARRAARENPLAERVTPRDEANRERQEYEEETEEAEAIARESDGGTARSGADYLNNDFPGAERYIRTVPVRAVQIQQDFMLGNAEGNAGDWIVIEPDDNEENRNRRIVSHAEFERTFTRANI